MHNGWVYGCLVALALSAGCTAQPQPSASTTASAHDGMNMDGMDHDGMSMGNMSKANAAMYTVATDISTQPETVYKFRPNSFSAHVGDVLNITLKNAVGDQYQHSLVIDELGVKIGPIPQEQAASKIVKLEKTGTFTFYCDVSNHRTLGMTGTLTVS